MSKQVLQHFDKLGREITVDCCVAYPTSNSLQIGKITKLNNKMVKVEPLNTRYRPTPTNKYPHDCVVVDGQDVTMWILKGTQ